jgi:hypothetical protein
MIFLHKFCVRKSGMRIFVKVPHVGVGGRAVEIEVTFFDIFAVVSFFTGQSEEALFEDGIPLVPEGKRKADLLMAIANATQSVFRPAIGPRTRMIVREITPSVAGRTVVFADSAPGSLGKIRPPAFPVLFPLP